MLGDAVNSIIIDGKELRVEHDALLGSIVRRTFKRFVDFGKKNMEKR